MSAHENHSASDVDRDVGTEMAPDMAMDMVMDADPGPPRSEAEALASSGESLDDRIVAALREVYDPEIPVNIYDLGLIYRIDCDAMGVVEIDMTLTAPGCPVAQTFPGTVEAAVQNVEGVATAEVDLVWEPPWTPDRMSEAAKLELGFF